MNLEFKYPEKFKKLSHFYSLFNFEIIHFKLADINIYREGLIELRVRHKSNYFLQHIMSLKEFSEIPTEYIVEKSISMLLDDLK